MAALVENPLENNLSGQKSVIDDSIKTGEVIQLKEAKFNEDGEIGRAHV